MDEFTNMAQQYSLKWNNHQPNFISMFAILRNTQALVDVTLAAEGRHLHAHKTVLSACSPYFHSLFVENPSQHPIVILKDVTFADLRTIVDFMYYGEVNITQEELPQMLNSAKSLKVKGLTETEPTSVMRSQSSDFPYDTSGEPSGEQASEQHGDVTGEQIREPSNEPSNECCSHEVEPQRRQTPSPNDSPAAKRRRCRKGSNTSTSINMVGEENRDDGAMEIVREDITLSSVTPRRREYSHEDNAQQTEPQNINIDDLNVDHNPAGMPQGGQWSMMEHTYPRYTNSCFGGAPAEGGGGAGSGVYMGGMMHGGHAAALEGELGAWSGGAALPAAAPLAEPPPPQPKRRRTTNPQSEENFQRALEAVRIGGIGFCKAARMFGVNNRTLWLEYKKKGYPNNRPSIKSRIKREHATPPPPHKEEAPPGDPHLALVCHPHAHAAHAPHHLSVGFVDPRPLDLPLQTMNILELMTSLRLRRSKHLTRQSRVEERMAARQCSEPAAPLAPPPAPAPLLRKHHSYPQIVTMMRRQQQQQVGSLLIRAVTVVDRRGGGASGHGPPAVEPAAATPRASHTPAVRSGPPLSCNFCWNTVDECGRILRRKTQYHCPECRTNLCIVPCFHEYHDAETEVTSVR